MYEELASRMKDYEREETERRFVIGYPIYTRLDGRGFSKFTKGMIKPFDARLHVLMKDTAKYLVEKTNAKIAYTQSDEISLVFLNINEKDSDIFMNRKITKMTSILASMASSYFCINLKKYFTEFEKLESYIPHFDARVICIPSYTETSNMILYRWMDCKRNAVSMAARTKMSHKMLQGMNTPTMIDNLKNYGVIFSDYPKSFRYGTFIKKETVELPGSHFSHKIPNNQSIPETVVRRIMTEESRDDFNNINRTEYIFGKLC